MILTTFYSNYVRLCAEKGKSAYFGVPVSDLTEEKEKAPTDGEREITFDDFTFAMQNESKDLTEAGKQILLSMARQLNEILIPKCCEVIAAQ